MRDAFEVKRERIRSDLANAREKASQWQARARDFERQLTELENTEILRLVHGVASSPEELRGLLNLIQAAQEPPQVNLNDKKEV